MTCRKRRYRDRVAAQLTLAQIAAAGAASRPKTEARAYRCPTCKGWHLTSKAQPARRP